MVQTSRVFATFDRLTELLQAETTWPPHPTTGDEVAVEVEGMGLDEALERVILLANPTVLDSDFQSLGNVRHMEEYTYEVAVSSMVPGQTMLEAKARLAELVAVIEVALRDQTSGMPEGGFADVVGGERLAEYWRVLPPQPNYWPTTEGWCSECPVEIYFRSRI